MRISMWTEEWLRLCDTGGGQQEKEERRRGSGTQRQEGSRAGRSPLPSFLAALQIFGSVLMLGKILMLTLEALNGGI